MSVPKILKNPLFLISIIVWLYVLIPFIAPIAYTVENEKLGWGINQFYENFCHQRVERSVFLFGKSSPISFYTVQELKDAKAIPQTNTNPGRYIWPEYFGHDYVGNKVVGYKVPICIRDIALYGSLALFLTIFSLLKPKTVDKYATQRLYLYGFLLLLPMILDGVAQTIIEGFMIKSVPLSYIHSISKRIVTGSLFGLGLSLILLKLFNEGRLTKQEEKGKI
ncbi:MAG: hypothetical protein UT34_C0001G0276 [candidate division WS6 bacterium GW2011_GWF2_39_15]|uniref:DUF2085 domain-containing protein n=1 Tax=candidate division WS6 bacterium GW2011_GWF2_39_15 TaxID=1619100 RepID=A0A0G0N089_9BACT|nr:MAG: hypothetical protein UT34_C0001G0276 [candidate division WS6 bacterium GW2011_GWF2_39_15]